MDLWQFTPLHEAASKNRVEVCSLLLSHGADPTLVNCHSKSALDVAPTRELADRIQRKSNCICPVSDVCFSGEKICDGELPTVTACFSYRGQFALWTWLFGDVEMLSMAGNWYQFIFVLCTACQWSTKAIVFLTAQNRQMSDTWRNRFLQNWSTLSIHSLVTLHWYANILPTILQLLFSILNQFSALSWQLFVWLVIWMHCLACSTVSSRPSFPSVSRFWSYWYGRVATPTRRTKSKCLTLFDTWPNRMTVIECMLLILCMFVCSVLDWCPSCIFETNSHQSQALRLNWLENDYLCHFWVIFFGFSPEK